jgi:hypothetical protein
MSISIGPVGPGGPVTPTGPIDRVAGLDIAELAVVASVDIVIWAPTLLKTTTGVGSWLAISIVPSGSREMVIEASLLRLFRGKTCLKSML